MQNEARVMIQSSRIASPHYALRTTAIWVIPHRELCERDKEGHKVCMNAQFLHRQAKYSATS